MRPLGAGRWLGMLVVFVFERIPRLPMGQFSFPFVSLTNKSQLFCRFLSPLPFPSLGVSLASCWPTELGDSLSRTNPSLSPASLVHLRHSRFAPLCRRHCSLFASILFTLLSSAYNGSVRFLLKPLGGRRGRKRRRRRNQLGRSSLAATYLPCAVRHYYF